MINFQVITIEGPQGKMKYILAQPSNPGDVVTLVRADQQYPHLQQAIGNPAVIQQTIATPTVLQQTIANPAVLQQTMGTTAVIQQTVGNPAVIQQPLGNPVGFQQAIGTPAASIQMPHLQLVQDSPTTQIISPRKCKYFLSPPVQLAQCDFMRHFLSACLFVQVGNSL